MASIQEGFLLCNSQEASLLGITISSASNHIIVTQNNRRIRVYNIVDQKLFHDWPAKTGQQLICSAVASDSETQYSVITDEQLIRTWLRDDLSVDKGHKTKLSKPAHKLFVIGDNLVVLYADGSLGSTQDMLHETSGAFEKQRIVWSDSLEVSQKNYVVAVIHSAEMNSHFVKTYVVGPDLSAVSVETVYISQHAAGCSPQSYCLQALHDSLLLVAIYGDGALSRTRLLPDDQLSCLQSELLSPLPYVSEIRSGLAVASIDSTQLAVISPASRDDQTLGLGVWDTRFGIFHSWKPLPDTKKSNILCRSPSGHLLLPCASGIYIYPIVVKRSTLVSSIGKMTAMTSQDGDDIPLEVRRSLQKLSLALETPTRSSFKKSFAVLQNWLPLCNIDQKLKVMPAVTAIIQRCIEDNSFWPIEELTILVKSRVVSSSVCDPLCKAFASHQEASALLLCITSIKDLSESSLATALSGFLSMDESKFVDTDSYTITSTSETTESTDESPKVVFSPRRAYYINRVLLSDFNNSGLLDALRQLKYSHVLDLMRHLEYLLYSTSVTIVDASSPSISQIVDWLSLLIDAHYPQMALSNDLAQLHTKLQNALLIQRQDIETLSDIKRSLLHIVHAKKDTGRKLVGSYCITVLRL